LRADSQDHYRLIQQAYKVLITPQQRKAYDLSLGIRQSLCER
jgi:DnaJ-class molecular chaperone